MMARSTETGEHRPRASVDVVDDLLHELRTIDVSHADLVGILPIHGHAHVWTTEFGEIDYLSKWNIPANPPVLSGPRSDDKRRGQNKRRWSISLRHDNPARTTRWQASRLFRTATSHDLRSNLRESESSFTGTGSHSRRGFLQHVSMGAGRVPLPPVLPGNPQYPQIIAPVASD